MRPLDPVVDRLEGAAVAGERRAGGEADDEVHRRAEFDEVASLADRWEYAEPARFGVDRNVHEAVERHRDAIAGTRSEEHTSELKSLLRISYAVLCMKKNKSKN